MSLQSTSPVRPAGSRADGPVLVIVYLSLLFGIPARMVFGPLGALGSPALVLGLGLGWWAVMEGTLRPEMTRRTTPVQYALGFFAIAMAIGYVAAFTRPVSNLERGGADRAVIALISLIGVAWLTSRVLRRHLIERFLRYLVVAATVLAVVGMVQFLTSFDPVATLRIPGLRPNASLDVIGERSSFKRVAATATHPVEFGVVLAMVFPVALHFAMCRSGSGASVRSNRTAARRWLPVVAMAIAIPFSVSRSAVVGLVAALLLVVPAWPWRRRVNAAAITTVFLIIMRGAVPGLLGTIKSMFTGAADDPSVKGRTLDLDAVRELFLERPVFGRGLGTFVPEEYFFLDNQFFGTVIETGLLGGFALVLLLSVAVFAALRTARTALDPARASLARAVGAGVLAGSVSLATFDGLSFRLCAGTLFLLVGTASAVWSDQHELDAGVQPLIAQTAAASGSR